MRRGLGRAGRRGADGVRRIHGRWGDQHDLSGLHLDLDDRVQPLEQHVVLVVPDPLVEHVVTRLPELLELLDDPGAADRPRQGLDLRPDRRHP
ncbi:hypothetical protein ACFUC1_20070 [Pedococcus sp. NPDC057267]|uniref:hypothetical protein n=1 Tax=Pedococcus sp. NPDC057267 TaxID=3346077 RepID=UPI003628117E